MTKKIRFYVLGLYDLFMAFGAIYLGTNMIVEFGLFHDYPKEWLDIFPFTSWVVPGILAICFYGIGNLIVAVLSVLDWDKIKNMKMTNKKGIKSNTTIKGPWLGSTIMGGVFLVSLIAQVVILNEFFLATSQFFILSIIQLILSGYGYLGCRKNYLRIKNT